MVGIQAFPIGFRPIFRGKPLVSRRVTSLPKNHQKKNIIQKIRFSWWLGFPDGKRFCYMGVSKNRGTPKWMVYKGNPIKHGMIWGYPYFLETPIWISNITIFGGGLNWWRSTCFCDILWGHNISQTWGLNISLCDAWCMAENEKTKIFRKKKTCTVLEIG